MNKRLLLKLLLMAGLLLVLLIPLSMLDGLVAERQARGWEVAEEIARSAGQAQTVMGPLLIIDGVRTLRSQRSVTENGTLRQIEETRTVEDRQVLLPAELNINVEVGNERRGRGPFDVVLFHSEQQVSADFLLPQREPAGDDEVDYRPKRLRVLLAVGDSRGIQAVELQSAGRSLNIEPGTGVEGLAQGVSADLPAEWLQHASLRIEAKLSLSGTHRLAWLPVADANLITARGDWPHPGFSGAFLPAQREVSASGFTANWQISRLASDAQPKLQRCLQNAADCAELRLADVGVSFVDPVDRYLLTDRAIKYALLMLVIVFGTVFFVEVLRTMNVHVMQYGLVGLALAIFYLLLLALSEHLPFALAYSSAALACGSLISYYMSPALAGGKATVAFSAFLFALYGLLYFVLSAEDTALLVGAVALFALLAAVMLISRRFDWNRVGSALPASGIGN